MDWKTCSTTISCWWNVQLASHGTAWLPNDSGILTSAILQSELSILATISLPTILPPPQLPPSVDGLHRSLVHSGDLKLHLRDARDASQGTVLETILETQSVRCPWCPHRQSMIWLNFRLDFGFHSWPSTACHDSCAWPGHAHCCGSPNDLQSHREVGGPPVLTSCAWANVVEMRCWTTFRSFRRVYGLKAAPWIAETFTGLHHWVELHHSDRWIWRESHPVSTEDI